MDPRRRKLAIRIIAGVFYLLGALVLTVYIVGCFVLSGPKYDGPESDHFDGEKFFSLEKREEGSLLRWILAQRQGEWNVIKKEPVAKPPERIPVGGHIVAFINHATMLIQKDGVNVLTDPIYSDRASPFTWAGPKRFRQPGIPFDDLPPIDAVVISHNHYDHLDLPTLKRLQAKFPQMKIFVPLGNAPLLTEAGLSHVTELDWWQSADLAPTVKLYATPAQHFSGRGFCDRNETLWASWLMTGSAGSTYFAGDTGKGPHFKLIREKFGAPRVAILPIGAYKPEWFMHPMHISPSEAVDAAEQLGAQVNIPMHYGTFALGDDGQTEAINELRRVLKERRAVLGAPEFLFLNFGEGRRIQARFAE